MNIERPTNILVRRRAAIGDVIMSTAVVCELSQRYRDTANIDVVTECIEVYRNNTRIRNVYHANAAPDPSEYDVYINLDDAYEYNPTNHYVDSYLHRAFGNHNITNKFVELFPNDQDRAEVNKDINEIGDKFIVIHMRQWHWAAKNVSMDTWFAVFERLFTARTDFKIVCVGGPTDAYIEDHPLFYDVRERYNSQQLKYLCDNAKCFVGIDSGPFQCAAASRTHIVALLTHLHPERILPYRQGKLGYNCTAIQTLEDCRGCNDIQTRPVRQLVCQKQTFPCSSNWDVDFIADSILKTLGKI